MFSLFLMSFQNRGYVTREGRTLVPSSLGRVLSAFLDHYFSKVCAPPLNLETDRLTGLPGLEATLYLSTAA